MKCTGTELLGSLSVRGGLFVSITSCTGCTRCGKLHSVVLGTAVTQKTIICACGALVTIKASQNMNISQKTVFKYTKTILNRMIHRLRYSLRIRLRVAPH